LRRAAGTILSFRPLPLPFGNEALHPQRREIEKCPPPARTGATDRKTLRSTAKLSGVVNIASGVHAVEHSEDGKAQMKITLEGKVALVTGAGAGIGRGIAQAFSDLGADLVIAEIDPAKCAQLRADFPNAEVIETDVRDRAAVERVRDRTAARFGRLNVLVNNVGHHLNTFKTLDQMEDDEWDAQHDINLRHMFLVTRAMLPLMRKAGPGGSIINLSSIEGFRGCPYNVAYTTFKHAVTGFTRAMALELANDEIRVNLIAPETTDSEQVPLKHIIKPGMEEIANRMLPANRYGRPEDHAGAAVYLATDLSSWVTGSEMFVDGGSHNQNIFKRTPEGRWTVMGVVTGSASAAD